MATRLGPFILEDIIGAGAMGKVYRARHASVEIPVAVKVDTNPPGAETAAAFLREVQITASLDHKNIVMVLDHGIVDNAAATEDLHEGSRWLAMELASGGTARDHVPRTWAEVMHLLRQLLEGLGHAHARGVIHRDIKLQNILIGGPDANVASAPSSLLDARVIVSDFGVSERQDDQERRSENPIGTPEFMAPELCEGRWRDHGPWTDLYAVGVLLWLLTARDYPIKGDNRWAVYDAQVNAALPVFRPLMTVPAGLDEVVYALLAKEPAGRPGHAAEVVRMLQALGPAGTSGRRFHDDPEGEAETVTLPSPPLRTNRSYAGRSRGPLGAVPLLHGRGNKGGRMHHAGLGLFGLRTAPFVGRTEDCDRLWNDLVTVRAEGRARFVPITGPAGIGKTRLAEWVALRAHELGVAITLQTRFRPDTRYGAGLVDMLERELRTDGLDIPGLEARLEARFPDADFDLHTLAAMLAPMHYARPPLQPAEARQLVLRVLFELAHERTMVVVLDDILNDPAALELVEAMLEVQDLHPRPILVLGTYRSEDLVDQEIDKPLMLGPLDVKSTQRMLRGLLKLDGGVSRWVEERSAGNPQLAREVLDSWVEQGALVPSARGFQLALGAAEVPLRSADRWRQRLATAVGDMPGVEALEVAAAWGIHVLDEGWRGACRTLQIEIHEPLLDALKRRHLVHLDDRDFWSFSHALLREILIEDAKAAGRWQGHNLGVAVWMQESGDHWRAADVARHILEAEVWEEAVEPLTQAIHEEMDAGDLRSPKLLDQLHNVLGALDLPPSAPEWGEIRVLRAARHRQRGELDDAERLARAAVQHADRHGHDVGIAKGLRDGAHIAYLRADYDLARRHARKAQEIFHRLGDLKRAAYTACIAAEVDSATGDFDDARELFEIAIDYFSMKAPERLHAPLTGMVLVHHRRGDAEGTAHWLAQCRAHAEPLGLHAPLAFCANLEGELARSTGHLDRAAACYREAAERFQAIESPDFVFPLLNLALLDAHECRFETALERLRPLLHHNARHPNPLLLAFTNSVLLAAFAGVEDPEGSTEALRQLEENIGITGLADADVARMAEQAGEQMLTWRWFDLARKALVVAETQYRAVDRQEDAARVRRLQR